MDLDKLAELGATVVVACFALWLFDRRFAGFAKAITASLASLTKSVQELREQLIRSRLAPILAVALVLLAGTGCAALGAGLDGFFGLDPATGERAPGDAPADVAGGILGQFVPWGAGALGALGWLYQKLHTRRYVAAGVSMARGVNRVRELPREELTAERIIEVLHEEQVRAGVHAEARAMVHEAERATN